jgi:hypothetical protein
VPWRPIAKHWRYHLYPESKFLNSKHQDRGPTKRRHIVISLSDVHYIGKETNDLDEQVFLGFDPEAQPEYGMEGEAYAALVTKVRATIAAHRLQAVSKASGVSARYLRSIRDGLANAKLETLKRIESAIPKLEADLRKQQHLLEWAQAKSEEIGLRRLAHELSIDPANLAKVLSGKRSASAALLAAIAARLQDYNVRRRSQR